ncbi:hypothetical protein ONS96_000597 [Cadophora gregata f. sp. sojae]|nr:hypothetical protein ONS96_000597 [Cadophora gregata f. sp. sojae]
MPRPTCINLISFFYPIGNTPADADILLLGCGDFRNILFTAYADTAPTTRSLDITCCDIEGAIIAQNILAFTVLLDDTEGKQHSNLWQIYYHMYMDEKSLKLLQAQAKKLVHFAETFESWKAGTIFKFCEEGTFNIVKKLWEEYATFNRSRNEQAGYDNRFKAKIEDAIRKKQDFGREGLNLSALRSASPASINPGQDAPKAHEHFWKYGTTDRNPSKLPRDRNSNPTFASQNTDIFTLHYGTDLHLGFPLATAYVPLVKDSPLAAGKGSRSDFQRITDAARTHFRAWCVAFRTFAKNLTLRFFVGDAIAFCHTLQHVKTIGNAESHWYRNKYTTEIIKLDTHEYSSSGSSPVTFDVIDTSNLVDHLGPVNVLVAASPLLKRNITSTMYTESLVAREKNRRDLMEKLLCGSLTHGVTSSGTGSDRVLN